MGHLETICDSFDVSNVNNDFRLWLTSYPSDKVRWMLFALRMGCVVNRWLNGEQYCSFQFPCYKTASKWPTSLRRACKRICSETMNRIRWKTIRFSKGVPTKSRCSRNCCTESRFSTPSFKNARNSDPLDGTYRTGSTSPTTTFPFNNFKYDGLIIVHILFWAEPIALVGPWKMDLFSDVCERIRRDSIRSRHVPDGWMQLWWQGDRRLGQAHDEYDFEHILLSLSGRKSFLFILRHKPKVRGSWWHRT